MDTHSHASSPDVAPQELGRARHGWGNFTRFCVYSVASIAALLVLMAIFLL